MRVQVMAGDIHLIERMGHIACVDIALARWESGWWAVSQDTARRLVGGRIYFHLGQTKPSRFGGRITGFRVETEGNWPGRIVFEFIAGMEFKDVRTGREGWGMEKKIVYTPST